MAHTEMTRYAFISHMEDYIKNDSRLSEKEKQIDQLSWVGLMNNYKSCAEEIVLQELIYN